MSDAPITFSPATVLGQHWAYGAGTFSSPPAITEINAADTYAQLVGLYNRRASQLMTYPVYLAAFSRARAWQGLQTYSIQQLQFQINNLRTALGMSAFSFTSVLAGTAPKAQTIIDLRSALNFSSGNIATQYSGKRYVRNDNPYGTLVSSSQGAINQAGDWYGKYAASSIARARMGISFTIPTLSGVKTPANVAIQLGVSGGWINALETFTPKCIASGSDDSAYSGTWYNNLNTPLSGGTYGATSTFVVPGSVFDGARGAHLSVVLGEDAELAGTGVGSSATLKYAAFFNAVSVSMTYDWGF